MRRLFEAKFFPLAQNNLSRVTTFQKGVFSSHRHGANVVPALPLFTLHVLFEKFNPY